MASASVKSQSTEEAHLSMINNTAQQQPPSPANAAGAAAEKYPNEAVPDKFQDEEQPLPFDDEITRQESLAEQNNMARILSGKHSVKSNSAAVPTMGGGKEYPPLLEDSKIYQVDFDGPADPRHPHNWPVSRKLPICAGLGAATFAVAWGSSVFASGVPFVAEEFHVAPVVAILGISLYVMGFASGPVIWSPISELYGRKLPILTSLFLFICFIFACATAENLQTLLLCRFFAGFTGSAPLTVVGAAFADMFGNTTRGIALTMFSGTVFCGPLLAPIVSGFIAESYLGWRWTQYITGIFSSAIFVFLVFFFEETYHPMILVGKAREIRERTGNWAVFAAQEHVELDFNTLVQNNLTRPLLLLFTEPIILLLTIYTAFLYGILYLFLEAYGIVFFEGYRMSLGVSNLPYIGLIVGQLSCVAALVVYYEPRYVKAVMANGGKPVPEARLPPMFVGGIIFPIGLLWFCWSGNYPDKVHWICPALSGLFTGYGLLAIFLPSINYIVDSYLVFAASALAGNAFLRSSFGAAFPLFAGFMFHGMGTNWAGLLLGLFAFALAPVPFLFYKYGKQIRSKSKFAFVLT